MGANQSSKHQAGGRSLKSSVTAAAAGSPQQQHKLGASLRKSVNNVLAQGKSRVSTKSSKQVQADKFLPDKTGSNHDDSGKLATNQQQADGSLDDPYYVSLARSNKSFAAPTNGSCVMNNYVTMQQQQQPTRLSGEQTTATTQLEQQRARGNTIEQSTNVLYGGGNFYVEPQNNTIGVMSQANASPLPFNGIGGSGNSQPESHNMLAASAVASRSKHQQQAQQKQQQPFQLSRAVNTKTSNVLNINGVAMPNATRHGRSGAQQQQQAAVAVMNTNSSGSSSAQSSPTSAAGLAAIQQQQQQYHQQQQQQQATYHNPAYRSASQLYATQVLDPIYHVAAYSSYLPSDEAENCHHPSLLNYYASPGAHQPQQQQHHHQQQQQQQQQIRYKSPKQQYQYRNNNNNNSISQSSAILDFHQATYQSPAKKPLQTSLLDCNIYSCGDRGFSASFAGSARTLDNSRNNKKNKLMSMFQQSSPASSKSVARHSNTIHLASHHHRTSAQSSNGNGRHLSATSKSSFSGSLKRIKSTPLTAQQASYEAMRTIDMYMIRQIARNCMDFEMEQKIDLEIRLRELAAQSMLEAQTEIDVLEVEKSLLTSDQRMNCYATQLEQQRKQLSNPSLSTDSGRGSKTGVNGTGNGTANRRQHRNDVIGQPQTTATGTTSAAGAHSDTTSSPSFSSLSNSQSPSKLSPVSGESANSQPSFTSSHHSRGTGYRHRTSSSSNTLNSRQRAKNKKREQLVQGIASLSNINCNMVTNTRASVSISELRIPLMWRDVDHFKGRGDYKRFAIFCLLKIDSQIYDTQLISDVDREMTDVTFEDVVVFNEIDHNFELSLEVYSCVYLEQFSLSSTPRKLKEKLTSSVSRAMGRRLSSQTASTNYTRELQAYDKSYRFAMIASATLRLEDASDSVKTYDLVLVSPSAHHRHHLTGGHYSSPATTTTSSASSYYSYGANHNNNNNNYNMTISTTNNKDADKNTLPLFGHFCAKLLVKPDVFERGTKAGYLRIATITCAAGTQKSNSPARTVSGGIAKTGGDKDSLSEMGETATLRHALAASTKMANLSMSCSNVHWGLLRNFALHLWPVDERNLDLKAVLRGEPPHLDNQVIRRPSITLNIDKYARLLRVSNSSLTIETGDKNCYVIAAFCPTANEGLMSQADEIGQWLRSIEQHIYDSHIWGSALNHYPKFI